MALHKAGIKVSAIGKEEILESWVEMGDQIPGT